MKSEKRDAVISRIDRNLTNTHAWKLRCKITGYIMDIHYPDMKSLPELIFWRKFVKKRRNLVK
jgi:hypothetical protein